ncbi:MAG: hypothetical protein LBI87_11045 [Candidatus Accumulibacter sp.]|jgi:hypothetical protein|nr:hypothetical protein [Accumulibacter sp.]
MDFPDVAPTAPPMTMLNAVDVADMMTSILEFAFQAVGAVAIFGVVVIPALLTYWAIHVAGTLLPDLLGLNSSASPPPPDESRFPMRRKLP